MSAGLIPSPPPPLAPPSPFPWPPPPPVAPSPTAPPPPSGEHAAVIVAIIVAIAACLVLAGVLFLYRRYYYARPLLVGQSTRRDSVSAYREGLDQRPVMRRGSTVQNLISPLDQALVNGEALQIKPSYSEQVDYVGLLVRAVGGTRGRPQVAVIGTPDGAAIQFDVDKRHLARARLADGSDAESVGRAAWQARFGAPQTA
jgi:hypothetical protein